MRGKIKVLLVGLGSEIGSTLISILNSKKNNLEIKGILTNQIFKNDSKKNFESIKSRLILNDPSLINSINYSEKNSQLIISNKKIKVFWGDIKNFNLSKLDKKYDVSIIATSKDHINNKSIMKKFLSVSKFVFGVTESNNFPSIYPNLIDASSEIFEKKPKNIYNFKDKIFALGSCQTNGWQSQLES